MIEQVQEQTTVTATTPVAATVDRGGVPAQAAGVQGERAHVVRVPHLMGLRTLPGQDSRGDRRKVRLTRLTAVAR